MLAAVGVAVGMGVSVGTGVVVSVGAGVSVATGSGVGFVPGSATTNIPSVAVYPQMVSDSLKLGMIVQPAPSNLNRSAE